MKRRAAWIIFGVLACGSVTVPSAAQQGRVVKVLPKTSPKPVPSPQSPAPVERLASATPTIDGIGWVRRPIGDGIARFYPDRAQRLQKGGMATIGCRVTATGALEACEVLLEDPADLGFGEAALRLSRLYKMRLQDPDGAPTEGRTVRIPIVFELLETPLGSGDLEPATRPPTAAEAASINARLKAMDDPDAPMLSAPGSSSLPSTAGTTSVKYASSLSGAQSCQDFESVAPDVIDASTLIAGAVRQTKGEFETREEFQARYGRELVGSLGGANFIAIKIPSSSGDLTYDADRTVFSVSSYAIESAINTAICGRVYCSSLSGVEWEIGGLNSNPLQFEVPRSVAAEVKQSHYFVLGLPVDSLRIGPKPYGNGFVLTSSARCMVLVSQGGSYHPNSPYWFGSGGKGRGR